MSIYYALKGDKAVREDGHGPLSICNCGTQSRVLSTAVVIALKSRVPYIHISTITDDAS